MEWLKGKKTYFIVAFGVLTNIINVLSGDMTWAQFFMSVEFQNILTFTGIGTVRAGVSKVGK